MIDANQFPGPALWQGLMFLAMPLFLWLAFRNDLKNFKAAIGGYAVLGVVLLVLIAGR